MALTNPDLNILYKMLYIKDRITEMMVGVCFESHVF